MLYTVTENSRLQYKAYLKIDYLFILTWYDLTVKKKGYLHLLILVALIRTLRSLTYCSIQAIIYYYIIACNNL